MFLRIYQHFAEKRLGSQRVLTEKYYEEVQTMYRQMRTWRHDYKNHLHVMKAHLDMGEYQELSDYILRLDEELTQISKVIETGNLALDAILNSKIAVAKAKEIEVSVILAGTVLVTAGNVFLRWCIGEALERGELSLWLLGVAGVLLAVTQLLAFNRQMLSVRVQKNICHRIQSKVLHSCLEGLEKNDMGTIATYYMTDVGQIDGLLGRILNKAFPDAIGWLITVGLMFAFDPFLGLASVAATVLPACLIHWMSRPIAKGTDEYQNALGEANQSIVSGLHNIETIKASCKEEQFMRDNREKLATL